MTKFPTSRKEFLQASLAALKAQIRRLGASKPVVRVPRELEGSQMVPGLHLHPMTEIAVQLVGVSRMQFAHQVLISSPGDLLLVPPGMAHHEIVGPPKDDFLNMVVRFHKDGIHIHFSGYRNNNPSPTILLSEVFANSTLRLESYFDEAARALQLKSGPAKQAALGLLQAGFWGLLEALGTPPIQDQDEHPTLARCRMLVGSHLSDPSLSVAGLAKECECSADYLSRLFHTLTGLTLSSYITEMRMSYAKELLKKSPLSIKEIASATGYRSPGYFIRVFRLTQGDTPMEYRKGISRGFVVHKS